MLPRKTLLFTSLSVLLSVCCSLADPAASSIEQARQFGMAVQPPAGVPETDQSSVAPTTVGNPDDDSFGDQQILKRAEPVRPFDTFAGASVFFTNNVALTHRGAQSDTFLVATFGLSASRKITNTLEIDFTAKSGLFRYSKYDAFDLDTVDAIVGLNWQLPALWDSMAFADYDFSDFFNGRTEDETFQNHGFTVGLQKAYAISRAQSVMAGVSAEFNLSDPVSTQRNELSLFTEYHVDLTRHLSADLSYRYDYEAYTQGDRRDNENTLTLSLQYCLSDWLAVIASTYFTLDRSNEEVFSYEALVGGLGLGVNIRF